MYFAIFISQESFVLLFPLELLSSSYMFQEHFDTPYVLVILVLLWNIYYWLIFTYVAGAFWLSTNIFFPSWLHQFDVMLFQNLGTCFVMLVVYSSMLFSWLVLEVYDCLVSSLSLHKCISKISDIQIQQLRFLFLWLNIFVVLMWVTLKNRPLASYLLKEQLQFVLLRDRLQVFFQY